MNAGTPPRVTATPAALQLIGELQAKYGPVLFHQSGGCCDGSSPMCYAQGEFIVGDRDVRLGEIGGAPVYISETQFEAYRELGFVIAESAMPTIEKLLTHAATAAGLRHAAE